MLAPPQTFSQLRALTWAAPLLVTAGVGATGWALGLRPASLAWTIGVLAGLLAWLLAMAAVWRSQYGVRHARVASVAIFLGACLPMGLVLSPALAPVGLSGTSAAWMVVGAQVLLLLISGAVHARRAATHPGEKRLRWSGCEVDMTRFTLCQPDVPLPPAERWVPPAMAGGLSVVIYQGLRSALPPDHLAIVGFLVGNTLSAWLCMGPLGRALGQSWQLAQLERQAGQRFVTDRLDWLTRERQRSPIGRRLAPDAGAGPAGQRRP